MCFSYLKYLLGIKMCVIHLCYLSIMDILFSKIYIFKAIESTVGFRLYSHSHLGSGPDQVFLSIHVRRVSMSL